MVVISSIGQLLVFGLKSICHFERSEKSLAVRLPDERVRSFPSVEMTRERSR